MRYRKLDENGDMNFGHGLNDFYIDSEDAVAQAVSTRLQLWRGEWFLDETEGTPYQQAILGMHTSKTFEPALRERILGTKGVESIVSLETIRNTETRALTVNVTIDTIYGETVLTEVL